MPSAGMDWNTGRVLHGWPHVVQSIHIIFTTGFGERIMREWFGSFVPKLLGENLTQPTVLRFAQAAIVAIELFEPRFKVRRVSVAGSPEELRSGKLVLTFLGDYRPDALQGNFRVDRQETLLVGAANGVATIQ